ncbi:hydrogen gas-evolving membrane-bound hydrogenase subunit E, partial [Staphylococcus pseudintermedius]
GYIVTLFFILMRAPDLALTQLVTETITTVLFIVSFSRLPNVPRGQFNFKKEAVKIAISLMTAITVVGLVFMIQQASALETISVFYHDAYEKSGGKNIVNAILGDFRALDTLAEGLVLIIAGLGIYTLLNFKDRRGQDERE